jgi:hypothetical protein
LCINVIIREDVYKVLICLVRIDQFELDKNLRAKYQLLRGSRPADFGISRFFCLSDPVVLIEELTARYGLERMSSDLL